MNDIGKPKIAVVGAGLTGLTVAYYLKKAGLEVEVFEKESRPGGVIQTIRENGYIYESGPNTGVLSHPEVAELMEEIEELCELEIADNNAKARWIWKGNKWEPLPSGIISGITTPLFTFRDKLRLLREPFRKKGTNPQETLAELVLRRMGKSFLDYAVDPFILGIYSGDPTKLVTQYALPKLYRLEQDYGSFIGGAIKKKKTVKTEREKKATREVFSIKGGLQNLIDALVNKIGDQNISLSCNSLSFHTHQGKFVLTGTNKSFTHLISTVGSYQLPGLLPFVSADKLDQVNQLQYAKVVQVALGFDKWEGIPLNAFGGLVPYKQNRNVLGILFLSSFLKNRAPENGALLSVFLGGIRKPEMIDLSDEQIMRIVEMECKSMMGLNKFTPNMVKIIRYQYAIPQYSFESEQKLKAISDVEKNFPGLVLAGNIRDGIGMADRIRQGKQIADQIVNSING